MSIADERYVRLTTRTADGRPKHVPVWITAVGRDQVGFTTGSDSWKVRRIRRNPQVRIQASDTGGTIVNGSTPRTGTARLGDADELAAVRTAIRRKYGFGVVVVWFMGAIGRLAGRGATADCALVITLD